MSGPIQPVRTTTPDPLEDDGYHRADSFADLVMHHLEPTNWVDVARSLLMCANELSAPDAHPARVERHCRLLDLADGIQSDLSRCLGPVKLTGGEKM